MRTNVFSRSTNRYHADGERGVAGHARWWGSHWADGTHNPAQAVIAMGDSVAYFASQARKMRGTARGCEAMRRALADDARRQMAYRDLTVSANVTREQAKQNH